MFATFACALVIGVAWHIAACQMATAAEPGTMRTLFTWPGELAHMMARSPDGRYAAIALKGSDYILEKDLVVRLVDADQGELLQERDFATTGATSLALSARGERIAMTTYDFNSLKSALFHWAASEQSPKPLLESEQSFVLLSRIDARGQLTYLTADAGASTRTSLVDASTRRTFARFRSSESVWWSPNALSDDNRVLALAQRRSDHRNQQVIFLSRPGDATEEQKLVADGPKARELALSPDGSHLASCNAKGTVRIWDVKTSALKHDFVLPAKEHNYYLLQFSTDGTLLAVAVNEHVELRRVADGHRLATAKVGSPVYGICFAAGRKDIFIGSNPKDDDSKPRSVLSIWTP